MEVVIFFESGAEKIKNSIFHQGLLPWTLISDPEKRIYKLYGVEESVVKFGRTMLLSNPLSAMKTAKEIGAPTEADKEASNTLIPADFLLNEDFSIATAYYGSTLDDHISIEDIKKFGNIPY